MTDDRFDRHLRAGLEREADAAAARQPSLERAMARLARRVDGGAQRGPQISLRPQVGRPLGLLVTVLLLTAVVVALLVAGGPRPVLLGDTTPSQFGTPVDCGARLPAGVVYELALPDELRRERLYDDGRLLTFQATSEDAFVHSRVAEAAVTRQQLSAAGLTYVRQAIEPLGLTTGCRVVDGAPVVFTTRLSDGIARLQTNPWPGAYAGFELHRTMTLAEEAISLQALEDITIRLQTDLANIWDDRFPRPADPADWVVEPDAVVAAAPTNLPAGDLSAVDVCELVAPATIGATTSSSGRSALRFSVDSPACRYGTPGRHVATISLRGERLPQVAAETVVGNLFGLEPGSTEVQADARRWFNTCWVERGPCPFAVAGWLDGVLVVASFEGSTIGATDIPEATGVRVLAAVFEGIDRTGLAGGR